MATGETKSGWGGWGGTAPAVGMVLLIVVVKVVAKVLEDVTAAGLVVAVFSVLSAEPV